MCRLRLQRKAVHEWYTLSLDFRDGREILYNSRRSGGVTLSRRDTSSRVIALRVERGVVSKGASAASGSSRRYFRLTHQSQKAHKPSTSPCDSSYGANF